MKIYRSICYHSQNLQLIKNGQMNEAKNLVHCQAISPSFRYCQENFPNDTGYNTFPQTKEMVKYFYASLLDAGAWINDLVLIFNDPTLECIVLELEMDQTQIEKFLGLGFYSIPISTRVEFQIPYQVLYDLIHSQPNKEFIQTLHFYHQEYLPKKESSSNYYQLLKQSKQSEDPKLTQKLTCYNTDTLYRYLCFSIDTPFRIIQVPPGWLREQKNISSKFLWKRFKEFDNQLITAKAKNDEQKAFIQYALSFLQDENEAILKQLDGKILYYKS